MIFREKTEAGALMPVTAKLLHTGRDETMNDWSYGSCMHAIKRRYNVLLQVYAARQMH